MGGVTSKIKNVLNHDKYKSFPELPPLYYDMPLVIPENEEKLGGHSDAYYRRQRRTEYIENHLHNINSTRVFTKKLKMMKKLNNFIKSRGYGYPIVKEVSFETERLKRLDELSFYCNTQNKIM